VSSLDIRWSPALLGNEPYDPGSQTFRLLSTKETGFSYAGMTQIGDASIAILHP